MKSKTLRTGLATAITASTICLTFAPGASASSIDSSSTIGPASMITVCAGNELSTVDSLGHSLDQEALTLALMQVQRVCEGARNDAEPAPLLGYANVVAFINTSPGKMTFGGYANSVPYGSSKPRNELSCIYHEQPFDGHANAWNSCGYGAGTTSITTSTTAFCPVPGTRWESMVSLYANRVHKQDAWATAIGI